MLDMHPVDWLMFTILLSQQQAVSAACADRPARRATFRP